MQRMSLHHFVQVFSNDYSPLSLLSLKSLSDLHINSVSLQQGCREVITVWIDENGEYGEYEANPLGYHLTVQTEDL